MQVTLLLPLLTASELEHAISTTVPGFTGNCVVVSIVLVHSVFSPVQSGAEADYNFYHYTSFDRIRPFLLFSNFDYHDIK